MVTNGALRAMTTLFGIVVLGGFVNALLDPLLIFGWGRAAMGMRGAAITSTIAWGLGFVFAFWLIRVRERLLVFQRIDWGFLTRFGQELLRIGVPFSIANMPPPCQWHIDASSPTTAKRLSPPGAARAWRPSRWSCHSR